jgi:hypothetical protein
MCRMMLLLAIAAGLAGCTEATANSLGNHTYLIQGPGVPGGSTAPDQRVASKLCPDGYRVVKSDSRNNTPDGYSYEPNGVYTNWTIRCL